MVRGRVCLMRRLLTPGVESLGVPNRRSRALSAQVPAKTRRRVSDACGPCLSFMIGGCSCPLCCGGPPFRGEWAAGHVRTVSSSSCQPGVKALKRVTGGLRATGHFRRCGQNVVYCSATLARQPSSMIGTQSPRSSGSPEISPGSTTEGCLGTSANADCEAVLSTLICPQTSG